MKEERLTTLPSILAEYSQEISNGEESSVKTQVKPNVGKENAVKSPKPERCKKKSVASKSDRAVSAGERRRRLETKRVEDKRLGQVADRWDQVCAEARVERQELLARKVRLQHQLIQAQDKRAELRRHDEEEARRQKREDERKAKEEKLAGLHDKFKLSLAGDRQQQNAAKPGNEEEAGSAPSTPSTDSSGGRGRDKSRRPAHKGYMPSDSYAPATSPMKELEDEEEEAEEGEGKQGKRYLVDSGVVTPADLNAVPWHHAQLYKMYGRNADYYIHPKMQPEKKKVVNPTLKGQKVRKMGHMGASHIWTTLRNDSMSKLYRTDRRFPQELKDAFSSHVREGINRHQRPVFRNFTETDDVPDLNRLLDQSLLRRVRVLRHKTELMYRSSQTNNDRTKVLLFNSPLPTVSDGDEDGIQKYLPSWDDSASESTEATYKRWLKPSPRDFNDEEEEGTDVEASQEELPKGKRQHPMSVLSPLGSDISDGLQNIWHTIMARNKPRPSPRLHFLTEEEAKSEGAFLEKLGLDKEKLDLGRVDLLPGSPGQVQHSLPSIKAHSAQESRTTHHPIAGALGNRYDVATAPSPASRFQSSWQPLSMQALMEYKDHMATEGQGEFQQGRPRMWNSVVAGTE